MVGSRHDEGIVHREGWNTEIAQSSLHACADVRIDVLQDEPVPSVPERLQARKALLDGRADQVDVDADLAIIAL